MTFAPPPLKALGAYIVAHNGVNLGIVGDLAHTTKGTSYHLGKDLLVAGAYSTLLPRDAAGLSLAASAIDIGKINGTLVDLQPFSKWLVARVMDNRSGTDDIREVITHPMVCRSNAGTTRRASCTQAGQGPGRATIRIVPTRTSASFVTAKHETKLASSGPTSKERTWQRSPASSDRSGRQSVPMACSGQRPIAHWPYPTGYRPGRSWSRAPRPRRLTGTNGV